MTNVVFLWNNRSEETVSVINRILSLMVKVIWSYLKEFRIGRLNGKCLSLKRQFLGSM
jgi:hypothetical protein